MTTRDPTSKNRIKSRDIMHEVIQLLLAAGFVPDGLTRQETVRIATVKTPVFGGAGGTLATFGGRQRFSHPELMVKVTVGLRTTFFYKVEGHAAKPISHLNTQDVATIKTQLESFK